MRGRIDKQFGIPEVLPTLPRATVNLIQQFSFGAALSRLFGIKERSPSPVMSDSVQPVAIVEDILKGGYPPRPRCTGAVVFTGGGINRTWLGVNCRGVIPSGNVEDKLVVQKIHISVSATTTMQLEVGRTSGVLGLIGGFAMLNDSTADQPTAAVRRSDFTGILSGDSADAVDPNAQGFLVPAGGTMTLYGPFIIGQGEGVFVHSAAAQAVTFSAVFECEEFQRT